MKFTVGEYLELLLHAGQVVKSELYQAEEKQVEDVTYDSGKAGPGSLFICKGAAFKKAYLEDAVKKGAVCYISEQDYGLERVPHILVKDIRETMPLAAEMFYQIPENSLQYVGITGTKGKTTTAYYVKGILDEYMRQTGGQPIACLTSVEAYDGKARTEAANTTPEALELYRHFRNACDSGISCLAMEVSSQALKYKRVQGIRFDIGVFLNISEDHISPIEHKDFDDYFQAKLQLFHQVKTACINLDSEFSRTILKEAAGAERILTFGTRPGADIYGHHIRSEDGKVTFSVSCDRFEQEFTLGMHGLFNVENALAAIAVAYVCGVPADVIKEGLSGIKVNGRMEEYSSKDQKIKVIVDYAHNGLSFKKIFDSVRKEFPGYKQVAVFGCPGGKALNRRKDMGIIAGKACSKIFLSADDPGTEPVEEICRQIGAHIEGTGCPWECIPDRETAIKKAIGEIQEKTVVLVLGKGGETSQKIGHGRCEYRSDPKVVRECLETYDREKA